MSETSDIKHERSQALIDYAYSYAKEAHGTQKRKYCCSAYITHPLAVARLVDSVTDDCEMICAALLHDVIEDTHVTYQSLIDEGFGRGVADLVLALTDVSNLSDGNRAVRKQMDLEHLAGASPNAKTIKLADLINNTESIIKHDPLFAKVYMKEVSALLLVLGSGNAKLYNRLDRIVADYYEIQKNR